MPRTFTAAHYPSHQFGVGVTSDGERAYLHYAWRVEATPVEPVSEEDQVEFTRVLAARLAATRDGARAEVLANFEHLL
ncbi:hypothetical protein [Allokutzneria sp. NRRL B-24872]|uniref:hypothetical protein n=1 Tax=Allokutzneria sp. NRRL B-24872 TaxID=1137961 RepID=UPI000A37A743|nr:hypothetical protein [Allokutzneria sp. NRRL B-24872]